MKRICFLALLLLPFGLFGQNEITGIGFIDLKLYERLDEYTQTGGLDLYKKPGEEIVACLEKKLNDRNVSRKVVNNQGVSEKFSRKTSDLIYSEWAVYHSDVLECYEEKDGFVQVKINDKKYWMSLNDLAVEGAKLILWKTHLPDIEGYLRVIYNMNLRTAPTVNSDKIMVVTRFGGQNGFPLAQMTGNLQGNWAEVNIHIWENNDYCEKSERSDRIVKGWIKYLDDKGFPNIFPAIMPCC